MRWLAALLLALRSIQGVAATAYVSDELVLGVYAEENNQGQRLATLHSGTGVETLAQNGEFTQVRLSDGTTGWVKSAFLTTKEPAVVRVKQLQEELDRTRATTPALAEAAARSEVERLKLELAAKQSELDAARAGGPAPVIESPAAASSALAAIHAAAAPRWPVIAGIAAAIGLACGFWLGFATLARRVRAKFGGIKVY
ncbi:MAG TPA: TIGR04211 family SH3 domain-containing protein [Steroidobacteraceae bacterium]|nr:TIGR04211 family SH3 domain-containing protein [Steroidobacteraceae bacterium]